MSTQTENDSIKIICKILKIQLITEFLLEKERSGDKSICSTYTSIIVFFREKD